MPINIIKINPVIYKLIFGEDYRTEFNEYIEAEFLEEAILFFKKIVDAKLSEFEINEDWYKESFLSNDNDKKLIALYSGLNHKTIENIKHTSRKEVVVEFSNEHYIHLKDTIDSLISSSDFSISMELSYRNVSVKLNSQESMVVINALTIIRSNIRGGAWSSLGKNIEAPLMNAFVSILKVDPAYYYQDGEEFPETFRETDFFFKTKGGDPIPVEIKLMGKGNPESTDGAIARESKIFFAVKLSDSNKVNLRAHGIPFIEFSNGQSIQMLEEVFSSLEIPYTSIANDLDKARTELGEFLNISVE
jgi:hypothetical protein